MPEDLYYVNGINGSTGAYLEEPLTPQEVGDAARTLVEKQPDEARDNVLMAKSFRTTQPGYRAIVGVDERELAETGWCVIFPKGAHPGLKVALQPLLDHRQKDAGDLFKVYEGDDGYLPGDTWESFRVRHKVSTGQANPKQMPYYVLLVGDPETIPYEFQFLLDVERAVGRIYFERLEDYATYAQSVVEAETQPLKLSRRATFFGTSNPDDRATEFSSQDLVAPLAGELTKVLEQRNWQLEVVPPAEATKSRLGSLLGGPQTPSLLFTATHGAGFNQDDAFYPIHQGALVTQDWPGPREWRKRLKEDFFFSGTDVGDDARLWGAIAVFFACFGAGTPRLSDFHHMKEYNPAEQLHLADQALLAPLPRRLLSHPKGGALAVVGHVERAWTASFKVPGLSGPDSRDLQAFEQLFSLLFKGYPIGAAMEEMDSRYAIFSTELTNELFPVLHQGMEYGQDRKFKVARLWTANNDARNYVIVGDPAVRLRVGEPGTEVAEHPILPAFEMPTFPEEQVPAADAQTRAAARRETERRLAGDETMVGYLPLPQPPPQADQELYGYWRDHIKSGYEHNDEMFRRILKAFLGPYHLTVWMNGIVFAVGILSFVGAIGLSIWFNEALFALGFGGLSVVAFLGYFISRPLRSLEENLEFITWLGMIYNTYWTRLFFANDPAMVQKDVHAATTDAIAELERLIDKHAEFSRKRPEPTGG
jgi:hypothetical protein